MVKLLVVVPSPREIQQVIEAQTALPHDKLWIKYTPSFEAYLKARDFFMEHKEYTHVAIAPDDLVPTLEGVQLLVEDIEKEGFDVVSAYCAVDSNNKDGSSGDLAICFNLVGVSREQRNYQWITRKEMEVLKASTRFIQCKHVGTPFTIFSRYVAERMVWEGDFQFNHGHPDNNSVAQDVVFCNSIDQMGLPIVVDTRVEFDHLRSSGVVLVNKMAPTTFLQKAGEPYPTNFSAPFHPKN